MPTIAVGQLIDSSMVLALFVREENIYASDNIDDGDHDDDDEFFCGMVDRRKALNFIFSRDHCHRSSPYILIANLRHVVSRT